MRFKSTSTTTAQFTVIVIYSLAISSFSLIQADVANSDHVQHTGITS